MLTVTNTDVLMKILESRGEGAFIAVLWTYVHHNLLEEEEFREILIAARAKAWQDGIDYVNHRDELDL